MRAPYLTVATLLAAFAILAALPVPTSAALIYQENFDNGSGSNQPMSHVGWNAYVGATATNYTNTTPGTGRRIGVSNLSGAPSGSGTGFGFAVTPSGDASTSVMYFAYTTEFAPLDPALYTVLQFSWRQHASAESVPFRLAVQIGGSWFAREPSFVNSGASQTGPVAEFPSEGVLRSVLFSTTGSQWRDVTFTPGSSLSLAGAPRVLDLPGGAITAAGVLIDVPRGASDTTARFDAFTIEGTLVPEPSSALLAVLALIGGCVALVGRRRRRACR